MIKLLKIKNRSPFAVLLFAGLLCAGLLLSSAVLFAGQVRAQEGAAVFPMEVYGEVYHLKPVEVVGARLSFKQVKPYLPVVLTQMNEKRSSAVESVNHLAQVVAAYETLYNKTMFNLVRRVKHFTPQASIRELEIELGDAMRAGQWKAVTKKYGRYSRSVPPQILETQKSHNKYLAVFYLYEMLKRSDEAAPMFEIGDEEHEEELHDHAAFVPGPYYENGFSYYVMPEPAAGVDAHEGQLHHEE